MSKQGQKRGFFATLGAILAGLLALIVLVWGGLNLAKFLIYKDYYEIKTDLCANPGLNDGFVCQGIAQDGETGAILVSGYMMDKTSSRIYVTFRSGDVHYVQLKQGEKDFLGHVGGVAVSHGQVFLSTSSRIYTLPLLSVLSAKSGDPVEVGEGTKINCQASFVYTDEEYLYVGSYHDGKPYSPDHVFQTNEGTHSAICTKYSLFDLSTPLAVYTLRDYVQGIAFTPEGLIVLSTSHGLHDTVYAVYREGELVDSGKTLDGAPVYHLDQAVAEIHAPAMGEDLDYADGRIITLTESASNKYIFGKFFFAFEIFALDFSKYEQ